MMVSMETNPMLKVLSGFTHASRTNAAKAKITNHDACLLVLLGRGAVARVGELMGDLRTWRPMVGTYKKSLGRYNYETERTTNKGKFIDLPARHDFAYLFNTSIHGGYGFVGDDAMTRTKTVHGWTHTQNNGARNFVTQRRTYWFRSGKGVYTVTAEGLKRFSELQAMGIAKDFKVSAEV